MVQEIMPSRRLPNGRFARVIQLPPGVARGVERGPAGLTGRVIVRTNARQVAEGLQPIPQRVERDIFKTHQEQAQILQTELRTKAALAYKRASTGRFARGLSVHVQKVKKGAQLRVTMINYRESRFLTNLGDQGFFKFGYPVPEYRIYAKGAEGLDFSLNVRTGRVTARSGKLAMKRAGWYGDVGRLKVPKKNVAMEAFRQEGRGGGESVRPVKIGKKGSRTPFDFTRTHKSSAFFYPLWVDHPGFHEDVVSEVVEKAHAKIINQVTELVTYDHTDLGGGHFESTRRPTTRENQQVVRVISDIIPLPDLTVRMIRRKIGFGSVEGAGLDRLNRSIE